jgi:malate permease and related proteins
MEPTVQVINRVLPILILILLGQVMRRRNFISEGTLDGLRQIVVNLALPAVLFVSFLQIELKSTYVAVFALIFGLCLGLLGAGWLLKRWLHIPHDYFPFLVTGFEYGMLGVSLFGSAYGVAKIGYIAVVDLGHEFFIWFVFLGLLLMKRDGLRDPLQLGQSFLRSPVTLAIVAGLALNALGAQAALFNWPVTGAVMTTLQFLGNLAIPLILLIVGYSLQLNRAGIKEALAVVVLRLVLLVPLALAVNTFVIRGWLHLEPLFEAAVFTLLILPPPFIVPLYIRPDQVEEKRYVNAVLILHTLVSIAVYVVYFVLNPGL